MKEKLASDGEPITVAIFANELDAELVAGRLRIAGIPAMVIFTNGSLTEWGGPIQLQVPSSREASAREIVAGLGLC